MEKLDSSSLPKVTFHFIVLPSTMAWHLSWEISFPTAFKLYFSFSTSNNVNSFWWMTFTAYIPLFSVILFLEISYFYLVFHIFTLFHIITHYFRFIPGISHFFNNFSLLCSITQIYLMFLSLRKKICSKICYSSYIW